MADGSLSSVVSSLVRAQMGTSLPTNTTDEDLDRHVAELILKEAKKKAEQYDKQGMSAYLPQQESNVPKTNKRFLSSIIRNTDDHNKSILRAQALSAAELRIEREAQERAERRVRAEEAAGSRRSRRGRDDSGRERKRRHRDRSWSDDDASEDRWHPSKRRRTNERHGSRRSRHDEDSRRSRHEDEDKERRRRHRHSRKSEDAKRSRSLSPSDIEDERRRRRRRKEESRSPEADDSAADTHTRHHGRSHRHRRRHRSRTPEKKAPRSETLSEGFGSGSRPSHSRASSQQVVDCDRETPESRRKLKGKARASVIDTDSRSNTPRPVPPRDAPSHHSRSPSPGPRPPPGPPPPLPPPADFTRDSVRPDLPSKMDKYFEESYDPRFDVTPLTVPNVPATGLVNNSEFEGWEAMLELIKQRRVDRAERKRVGVVEKSGKEKKSKSKSKLAGIGVAGTLAGWSEVSGGNELMDIEYKKRGSVREWDLGKETPT